ncbi:MAG: alkaline phosphatase family protein [Candidatus Sumerlaeota bacterium]|nr:alkaline phosphatase family protein [Candidatus Sumerlaeota bacterium]
MMNSKPYTRRDFLKAAGAAATAGMAARSGLDAFAAAESGVVFQGSGASHTRKVLILGIDGMDPNLLCEFVSQGLMPNFKRLIDTGDFKKLATSMPPQSPVAWATFITGLDPGGHGIFDFVHRDPATMAPYLSMSRAEPPRRALQFGSWVIPLKGGTVEQLRKGRAFWELLDARGIPATIYKIPANFPPGKTAARQLSGMGTPDILGTSGTFSYYTTRMPERPEKISGGKVYPVRVIHDRVEARLFGPRNQLRRLPKTAVSESGDSVYAETPYENPALAVDFSVSLDAENDVALFQVQGREFVLQEGEWSDWIEVEFKPAPWAPAISAACRFYLQQARPEFSLYVTPLQINPRSPAMPISQPAGWSRELVDALGHFYTQELPEEPKALRSGVLTGREFWQHAQFLLREQQRALDFLLQDFQRRGGLLFFYFSSLDQGCHMFWRYTDKIHPAYDGAEGLQDSIRTIYREMDETLGKAMTAVDDNTTFIIMSDHGFVPFYSQVNLNTWLMEKGHVTLLDPAKQELAKEYTNVDWSRTRAYALGLNGIYVNLSGREKNGIVKPEEYDALLDQLEKELLETRDPRNNEQPISLIVRPRRDFHGPYADAGPDLIVGYNWGYRTSWASPLGEFPKEIFLDNKDAWSADHCLDHRVVPGVLLTNQRITLEDPALHDLTVAVLAQFGLAPLPEMRGRNCLGPRTA